MPTDISKTVVPVAVLLAAIVGTATIVWKGAAVQHSVTNTGQATQAELRSLKEEIARLRVQLEDYSTRLQPGFRKRVGGP